MKTEYFELSDTRKNLVVEIPSSIVDAEIDRLARRYSRAARIPGFRPGKVPPKLVRKRFRDQILHDVAQDLIPRAVDEALRERSLEPVDTPDIEDVVVEEGQPLKFCAFFQTVPPIDPGDYGSITLRRPPVTVEPSDTEQALGRLRERAARYEPVDDRTVEQGDAVVVDLERRMLKRAGGLPPGDPAAAAAAERHEGVSVEIGGPANPPGFDEQLVGLAAGANKDFTVVYPADHAITALAGTEVHYAVTLKAIRRRVLPDLDDEFAKDLGEFETLAALRERVHQDLLRQAEHEADGRVRADLIKQLAARVTFEVPDALVSREIDRRLEEFVSRLVEQGIDARQANIDWPALREKQREPAAEAVRGALVLDEVARRENVTVTDEDLRGELGRYGERTGRTESAVRARLEKEGGLARLHMGLRRERVIDLLLSRATLLST